jgi:diazepam-binding inhibitor (GABA receptor modulating acyl-CoA-binding protein)
MSGNIETDIINKFNELTQKVKNSSADPNVVVPDDIKLKFYSYYKQATIGDCNTECPGIFEFQKKALWNEWNKLKGTSKNDAAKMYIYYAEQYV